VVADCLGAHRAGQPDVGPGKKVVDYRNGHGAWIGFLSVTGGDPADKGKVKPMKELVVISGKGGTGKTSVLGSFAALSQNAVFADCDVDAADLHLILKPEIQKKKVFKSGREAVIRSADCTGCGRCEEVCRFEAVKSFENRFRIDSSACEGCGVCVHFCPAAAIDFPEAVCGEWFLSNTRFGPMVHARLSIGAENSGKLVSVVRQEARRLAEETGAEWLLVDGPPGIGCPVIASITGADAVLVVSEPTVAGEHDLERVLALTKHFQILTSICVNKWDVNPEMTSRIEALATQSGATVLGRIPYDRSVTAAQLRGQSVVEWNEEPAAQAIRNLWKRLSEKI